MLYEQQVCNEKNLSIKTTRQAGCDPQPKGLRGSLISFDAT